MDVESTAEALYYTKFWELAVIFIIGYFILNSLKSVASTLFSFAQLKTDEIGMSTEVEYQRQHWRVVGIGLRRMELQSLDKEYHLLVPTSSWKTMSIIVRPHSVKQMEDRDEPQK